MNSDVLEGFMRAARIVASRLSGLSISGSVEVSLGDSRRLESIQDQSIDLIITSPPYLNADRLHSGTPNVPCLAWLQPPSPSGNPRQ